MTDVKTPEGRKALRELCASISKEWVPETDNEHIVLSYSENANEYQEVFEACNEQVAQAILDLKTAVPALLDALERMEDSERAADAEITRLKDGELSRLTSERDLWMQSAETIKAENARLRERLDKIEKAARLICLDHKIMEETEDAHTFVAADERFRETADRIIEIIDTLAALRAALDGDK